MSFTVIINKITMDIELTSRLNLERLLGLVSILIIEKIFYYQLIFFAIISVSYVIFPNKYEKYMFTIFSHFLVSLVFSRNIAWKYHMIGDMFNILNILNKYIHTFELRFINEFRNRFISFVDNHIVLKFKNSILYLYYSKIVDKISYYVLILMKNIMGVGIAIMYYSTNNNVLVEKRLYELANKKISNNTDLDHNILDYYEFENDENINNNISDEERRQNIIDKFNEMFMMANKLYKEIDEQEEITKKLENLVEQEEITEKIEEHEKFSKKLDELDPIFKKTQ